MKRTWVKVNFRGLTFGGQGDGDGAVRGGPRRLPGKDQAGVAGDFLIGARVRVIFVADHDDAKSPADTGVGPDLAHMHVRARHHELCHQDRIKPRLEDARGRGVDRAGNGQGQVLIIKGHQVSPVQAEFQAHRAASPRSSAGFETRGQSATAVASAPRSGVRAKRFSG